MVGEVGHLDSKDAAGLLHRGKKGRLARRFSSLMRSYLAQVEKRDASHYEGKQSHDHTGPMTHHVFQLGRSEEHTSELQSLAYLVCRLLLEKKKNKRQN